MNDSPTPFDTPNSAPSTQIATRRPLDLSRPNADGASNLNAAPFSVPDDEAGAGGGALRQTLAMLRRRLKAILATLVCVTIAALVFLSMVPTVYESVATLQVHTAPIEAGDSQSRDLPVLADLSGATQSRSMETQLAILKSNAIQQGALKRLSPRARNEAAKYFDMSIEAVGDTDLIALTSRSFDRYTSASLSNEFCKEYMQLSRSKNRGQLQTATKYVGDQLRAAQARLNGARERLRLYKQNNRIFDLPNESQNLLTEAGQINSEWRQARADKAAQLAQLSKLRSVASGIPATRVVPQEIVRRPAVETIKAQLTKLELDRLAALQEYQADRPEVKEIEGQIAAIRQRLRSEAQTEVGSWTNQVNPIRQNLSEDIAKLQGQVWATEARGVALKASSQRAAAQLSRLPAYEQRLGQLNSDLTAQQQAYTMLNEKHQSLLMTQEARVANASILFSADPGAPLKTSKARTLGIALVLGLILAIALATMLDWLDDRVHSEQDARLISRLPVLAQIPFIAKAAQQSLLQGTFERSASVGTSLSVPDGGQSTLQVVPDNAPLLESFRMARTRLALASGSGPIASVVVTSSVPNEGKSMASLNLAIAAALGGERVIIVDCDLRRPSIHQLLQLPNEVGLSSVIGGSHSLAQALQATKIPNLLALTSGPLVANSFQLLNSPAARACLQQVLEQADFVVVDSPPALILADAQILATMTDATLLVISSREAGRREIIRTRDLLSLSGSRPVGVILNKLTPGNTDPYGYGQYGYFGPTH